MLIEANETPGRRRAQAATRRAEAAGQPPRREAFPAETIVGLFQPWESAQKILLAVSGGPDSIALMLLAADWTKARPGAPHLHVATVDHGLRPESSGEAEMVGLWAHRLGLAHDILVWSGEKPKSKIQERARDARYELLFKHAARIGADVVATGHHADDQAETILFRLLRGSGLGGLSGMAASLERLGLTLARPMLSCGKAELVACCEARAHPFFTDPSNRNPAYARTRMRPLCNLLDEAGLGREALIRLGRRAARAEAALAARTTTVAAALAPAREPGRFRANVASLAHEPEEIFLRVLNREIVALGDQTRPLRLERLETLALSMQSALRASEPFSGSLGGATLKLSRDHMLTIQNEGRRRGVIAGQQGKLRDQ